MIRHSLLAFAFCGLRLAASAQELTHTSLDAAGGHSTGGSITNDATLGDMGGSAYESTALTARTGFAGQLWDAVGLDIQPNNVGLLENSSLQLSATLMGDDATTQLPAGNSVWFEENPWISISQAGLVSVSLLPGDQLATVSATCDSVAGSADIFLMDQTLDDYGAFAGDGLDDGWQWAWFSSNPSAGLPAGDPDGDGQDNHFEFLAGTFPTDASSFLQTWMAPEPSQSTVRQLFFSPFSASRSYAWEWSTDLQPPWQPVLGDPADPLPSGGARATDEVADEARKFYRLRIAVSPEP